MNNKTAAILSFLGGIFWLIALLACQDKKAIGKTLTAGLIITILCFIPLGITQIIGLVLCIMGIVKVCQGEEDPELPVIGQWNWFGK